MPDRPKNPHAAALGSMKSAKKAAASRENGKKGGRKSAVEKLSGTSALEQWNKSREKP